MKSFFQLFTIACLFCLSSISAIADSPITSTEFYKAYMDIPIVRSAANNQGKLSADAKRFLYNENNPLDQKMALINAIGWNFDGLTSYQEFIYYCKDQFRTKNHINSGEFISDLDIVANLSNEQLIVLAYLSAMSDYFDMHVPYMFLRIAESNDKQSQAYRLPAALIYAQIDLLSDDWCSVYTDVYNILVNAERKDMRPEAIRIIMDYIDGYKEYCK